jgi:nicotinamidase-related amidase
MLNLDPHSIALTLIDLQDGIVSMAEAPRSEDEVVKAAKALAMRFREAGAPVVLVHVEFSRANMPSQKVDKPGIPPARSRPQKRR